MNIIENNAFRILALPITARNKDIVKRFDELLTLSKVGKIPSYITDFEWISKIDRSEESLRKAFYILQTKERKIEHIIFWFWELNELDRTAIAYISKENMSQAIQIWSKAMDRNGDCPISYLKNLATLSFIFSLQELKKSTDAAINTLGTSIEYWSDLVSKSEFWESINRQSFFQNQPKLSEQELEEFILMTLHKNAYPFITKTVQTDISIASKYIKFLTQSKFSFKVKNKIVEDFFNPYITQIRSELDKSEKKRLISAKNSFSLGMKIKEKTKYPLEIINLLLPEEDEIRIAINEKVGYEIYLCAVTCANHTNELEQAKSLLNTAESYAQDLILKEKIHKYLEILEQRIEYSKLFDVCWFCNKNNASEKSACKSPLYRITRREGPKVYYQTIIAKVPRCSLCKKSHKTEIFAVNFCGIIGAIIGGLIGYYTNLNAGLFISLIFGLLIGVAIGNLIGRDKEIKSESKAKDFPPLKKLFSEGWNYGERPSD